MTLLGHRSRESLLQTPAQALYADPAERGRWQKLCESNGIVRGFEAQLRRADGTAFWARDTARAVRDEAGTTLGYEGVLEDVSQSRRARQDPRMLKSGRHDGAFYGQMGWPTIPTTSWASSRATARSC